MFICFYRERSSLARVVLFVLILWAAYLTAIDDVLGMKHGSLFWLAGTVIEKFGPVYGNIIEKSEHIKKEIDTEEQKFRKTLEHGLKEFEKGVDAFTLFSSYGFPLNFFSAPARESA